MNYKIQTNCRICGSEKLTPYLNLGNLPLSNNLAASPDDPIHEQRFPLQVLFCQKCGLSQLSIVIPAETMFSHYVYRSSISKGYVEHCREMAVELKSKYKLNEGSFHIDIAGNDGALLAQFREVVGCKSLNVDPAGNLVGLNDAQGIRIFKTFWGIDAASHLLNTQWPKADLITATNVFAHVDNVREFLIAVKMVLKKSGVLVMEFPYLIDFIDNREFDTIYFEHLSYFSIYPLNLLCEELGLKLMQVQKENIHGGSVRVTIGYGEQGESVGEFIRHERRNYGIIDRYYDFARDVRETIGAFKMGLKLLSGSVAGFAASAKGNTLLNVCGVTRQRMEYIIDQTPEKIGKYSPGTRIPIYDMDFLIRNQPDYLVILSWNFANEIMNKCRDAGYNGLFILPIPEFKVVANALSETA